LADDLADLAKSVPPHKIFFLQLADAPKLSMDALSWSRHHRLFPGQGELPVAPFLRDLLATGWKGALSLEVFNDEFRAAPSRRIARDGLRSLILLEETVGLAPLPALPKLSGIEFVEFALDGATRQELGGFLASMGFLRAGLHRSKDVELWRNGGANLVLNAEADSAASERFEQRGASVCAMDHMRSSERRCARLADHVSMRVQNLPAKSREAPANKPKAATPTAHNATQAANRWPSAQVSIIWSATTTKAATTAANNRVANVRVGLNVSPMRLKLATACSARATPGCEVGYSR
jgi:hypothetical protein